jgi:hypothetical protein
MTENKRWGNRVNHRAEYRLVKPLGKVAAAAGVEVTGPGYETGNALVSSLPADDA